MNGTLTLIIESLPLMLKGAGATLTIWLLATLIALTIGTLWGILTCTRLRVPIVSNLIDRITFVLRAIPVYVQILIVYFVLPDLLGINLSPLCAGIVALGLCSAGYTAQIIRGGINAVTQGQWEAAYVLGFDTPATLRSIILPQMLRNAISALSGELDQLLKSTSLLSTIGFLELTRVAMNITAQEMQPIAIYLSIAVLYLIMSLGLNWTRNKLENKFRSSS